MALSSVSVVSSSLLLNRTRIAGVQREEGTRGVLDERLLSRVLRRPDVDGRDVVREFQKPENAGDEQVRSVGGEHAKTRHMD